MNSPKALLAPQVVKKSDWPTCIETAREILCPSNHPFPKHLLCVLLQTHMQINHGFVKTFHLVCQVSVFYKLRNVSVSSNHTTVLSLMNSSLWWGSTDVRDEALERDGRSVSLYLDPPRTSSFTFTPAPCFCCSYTDTKSR